jgi:hypothetical protein
MWLMIEVELSVISKGDFTHLDLAVSKEEPHGTNMRFDHLTPNSGGIVQVTNTPKNKIYKQVE